MPENAISIAVVGDVIPSRSTFPGGSPASPGFGKVVEVISGADVAVANLDTALTDRGHPRERGSRRSVDKSYVVCVENRCLTSRGHHQDTV